MKTKAEKGSVLKGFIYDWITIRLSKGREIGYLSEEGRITINYRRPFDERNEFFMLEEKWYEKEKDNV